MCNTYYLLHDLAQYYLLRVCEAGRGSAGTGRRHHGGVPVSADSIRIQDTGFTAVHADSCMRRQLYPKVSKSMDTALWEYPKVSKYP